MFVLRKKPLLFNLLWKNGFHTRLRVHYTLLVSFKQKEFDKTRKFIYAKQIKNKYFIK